ILSAVATLRGHAPEKLDASGDALLQFGKALLMILIIRHLEPRQPGDDVTHFVAGNLHSLCERVHAGNQSACKQRLCVTFACVHVRLRLGENMCQIFEHVHQPRQYWSDTWKSFACLSRAEPSKYLSSPDSLLQRRGICSLASALIRACPRPSPRRLTT